MYTRCYTDLLQVIWVKTEIIIIIIKNELKPTLPLMNLYFIDFMTKFTFIFLSWPPSHTHLFTDTIFHLVKRGKQHTLKKKKNQSYTQQKGPPAWIPGRLPATTLAAKLSLFLTMWHRTGEEVSNSPQVGRRTKCFFFLLPPKVVSQTQESNSFVPVYFFTFPEQTQYPESKILFEILAVISLAKETAPREINKEKSYTRCRLTFYLFFLVFPFFLCQGNEMKNISAMVHQPQTHTQWPATYPKQLQVSLEVTTIFSTLCT